jgi:hypothetical protein
MTTVEHPAGCSNVVRFKENTVLHSLIRIWCCALIVLAFAATAALAVAEGDSSATVPIDSTGLSSPAASAQPDTMSLDDRTRIKAALERMSREEVDGQYEWQRRKNPKVAMLSSMALPGLGQLYNGRRIKVAVAAGFFSYYFGNVILNNSKAEFFEAQRNQHPTGSGEWNNLNQFVDFHKEEARTFVWWSGLVWVLALVDSWIDAHLYDIRAYTPPAVGSPSAAGFQDDKIEYLSLEFEF